MRCAFLFAFAFIGSASADIAIIPVSRDNTLYEDPGGTLSNGSGQHLFAGTTLGGSARRAVLYIDLAPLPQGAIILNATLKLHMSRTISGLQPTALHRLLADWGEGASDAPFEEGGGTSAEIGDATWIHRFYPGATWSNPGGDFFPLPSATTLVDNLGFYNWSGPLVAADVQQWVNDPSTNFGWTLICNEQSTGTAKRFDSRENPNADNRPVLIVEYIPSPGAGVIFALASLRAVRRRR